MITILHGDDAEASRRALPEKAIILESKNATAELLTQLLEGESLIGETKQVVIENPKILPKNFSANLVLWYDHKITAGQIKEFPGATVREFKLGDLVFKFVESLRPGNQKIILPLFEQYCRQEMIEIVFTMIIRQFRLMLDSSSLSGWQKDRFNGQAKFFTLDQLKICYEKLLAIDYDVKNGQSVSDLKGYLELFLLSL